MFKIVIPSYNRSREIYKLTLKIILDNEINNDVNIYIFIIQDEYEEYKYLEKYKNIILVIGYLGLVNQRNYIKDYFNTNDKLIILDDDLKKIILFNEFNKTNFLNICIETFKYMEINKIYLCGINPTSNLYFGKNELKKGLYFCVGCCYFEINNKHSLLYLRNKYHYKIGDLKEDYIRSIKHYKYNGIVGRNNKLTIEHIFNGTKGGMNGDLKNDLKKRMENNDIAINLLYNKYPNFLKLQNKKKGKELKIFNQVFYKIYISKKKESNIAEYYDGNDFKKLCNKKNFIIIDKDNKKPLAIVLRNVINKNIISKELLKKINSWSNYQNENRGDMAGKIDINRLPNYIRKNYNKNTVKLSSTGSRVINSNFNYSNTVNCITLGYYNGKKLSQYDNKNSSIIQDGFIYFIEQLNNIYKHIYLDNFETIHPEKNKYLNSYFTSITINKGSRSAVHKDKNNLKYWALLIVLEEEKNGSFNGCDLSFTDYKINLNINKNKDIILFDSKNINHSNTEYDENDDKKSRFSYIFFSK